MQTEKTAKPKALVLVVDDNQDILHLISVRLRAQGYATLSASNGVEALVALEKNKVDLVVSDIMMPQMDGYDFLRTARRKYSAQRLPIIMLSASGEGQDVIDAMQLGASDYAIKGSDTRALIERVSYHLQIKNTAGPMLGPYRLDRRIGSGGDGQVYEATDLETQNKRALKVLYKDRLEDKESLARFEREAAILTDLRHPNVVRCYGIERSDDALYMVMELLHGRDLEQTRVPRESLFALLRSLGQAVYALHQNGIVHRDIKPANVLLDDFYFPKLSDLGVAYSEDSKQDLTQPGMGVGTLLYASPEQIFGEASRLSDIYSFGATAFFALSGQAPFAQDDPSAQELLERKQKKTPKIRKLLPACSRSIEKWLEKTMEPKVEKRFQSIQETMIALDALSSEF